MFPLFKKPFTLRLKDAFIDVEDLQYQQLYEDKENQHSPSFLLIYQEYLAKNLIQSNLYDVLTYALQKHQYDVGRLSIMNVQEISTEDMAAMERHLFSGNVLVYAPSIKRLFAIPNPQEMAFPIHGLLTEQLEANVGEIRYRFKSKEIKHEMYRLGTYSKNKVSFLYMDDVCPKDIRETVKERLNKIQIESIVSMDEVEMNLDRHKSLLLPTFKKTKHINECLRYLRKGYFAILLEKESCALIGPATLSTYLDTVSQNPLSYLLEKAIKVIALGIALFLIGLSAAVLTYHPELLPYVFINNVLSARKGVFVSIQSEFIIGEFLFTILLLSSYAKNTFPKAFLIILGLFLSAFLSYMGLIGPDILILLAISFLCTFTLSKDVKFLTCIYLLQLNVLVGGLAFGLMGFSFNSLFTLLYFLQHTSFGVPFLTPFAPISMKRIMQSLRPSKKAVIESVFDEEEE